jgi:hypothetical protein
MAFLDNSGDIILDAVLTDTGRKRMAAGNFKITRFALGDDEINYGLYNKDHPSGSAYYDLEVLQSPILEAFTHINASINYGLVSYARNDLLYLPSLVINTQPFNTLRRVASPTTNVFYCPTQKRTMAGVSTFNALGNSIGTTSSPDYSAVLGGNDPTMGFIGIETGLNSTELAATQANQSTFLGQVGLLDSQFIISYDRRFITAVVSAENSNLSFGGASIGGWSGSGHVQNDQTMSDYLITTVPAITSRLYASTDAAENAKILEHTTFTGPRGVFACLDFVATEECVIDQEIFRRFGTINSSMIAGDATGQTYDYIDTIVYVRGLSSNVTLHLPIRIVSISHGT